MLENNLFKKYEETLIFLQQQFIALYIANSKLGENNPIEHLKYRIKTKDSIIQKLNHLKEKSSELEKEEIYSFSEKNIDRNLNDVVGIRVICPFLSDTEKVIKTIRKTQTDMGFKIIEEKDYINEPKASGYSSYHIKIKVEKHLPNIQSPTKAEIQVRTITMDMLASLEHKIRYKKGIELPIEMEQRLNQITRYCNLIDIKLNDVLTQERKKKKQTIPLTPLPNFMKTKDFDLFLSNYQQALDILNNKILQFSLNHNVQKESNPIEHIKSRIKSKERIVNKLERKHLPITMQNIEKHVNDIAGVRIVCSFKSDVEEMIQMIKKESSKKDSPLEILEEQDYNKTPKKCGYRSYHILVKVPVSNQNKKTFIKIEIQLRTMAQEMWAILQERLCYQKEVDKKIEEELTEISKVLSDIDTNMDEMIKESRILQKENSKAYTKKKVIPYC